MRLAATLIILAPMLLSVAALAAEPLAYRIASFHRGRADKELIKRAAELGFNGVQFQLEGSTTKSLREFAERNKTEGYIDMCHRLGMKVTLWVHELSDIPDESEPGYLGPIELGNEKLWTFLDKRYEWLFGELLPDIDGIVLTVVETQIRATDTDMMVKLVGLLRGKCHKYGKELTVRTFVWHPDEFEGVMGCVKQLPDDVIIMTKCVPQDWQMRGANDAAIGNVGDHRQIVEYDVCGEYFLTDHVANCFPDLLKEQFDHGISKGVDGVCVRVDRGDAQVLHQPSEVNLWALGMFASGKTDSVDEAWRAWTKSRYGEQAAEAAIRILRPTREVVTEALCLGPFTYGDTRGFPANVDSNLLDCNWQNQRWDHSYRELYEAYKAGDPALTRKLARDKQRAMELAEQSLKELRGSRKDFDEPDYLILETKLLTNQVQLEYRSRIMMCFMRYRRILSTENKAEKQALAKQIRYDLGVLRAMRYQPYPPSREIEHLGRKWKIGYPEAFDPKRISEWADKTEGLLKELGL